MAIKKTKGRDPIRGPIRWPEAEWSEVQRLLAETGASYAEIARRAILAALKKAAKKKIFR